MSIRGLLPTLLLLAGCTGQRDSFFEEATREYRVVKSLLTELQVQAAQAYTKEPERIEFIDVSTCGPTLEPRAICTTQSSVILPRYRVTDPEVRAREAASLSARLPELRAEAERAYRACIVSGPAR